MSGTTIVYPPPSWSNQDIVLYHGTVDVFAPAILTQISVSMGRSSTDFGPGFYATTLLRQAHTWAAQLASSKPGTAPAVIEVTVSRNRMAGLETLAFVRCDFDADDYWSFVHYCRKGAVDHGRPDPHRFYDLVYGPVAAFWKQRMSVSDADQLSFHTTASQLVLNSGSRRRII
jgi:hypothetical protein